MINKNHNQKRKFANVVKWKWTIKLKIITKATLMILLIRKIQILLQIKLIKNLSILDFTWESMVSKVLQKIWKDHNHHLKIDHKVTYLLIPKFLFNSQRIKELDILMIKNQINRV